jgi:hypothetical protein
MQLSTESKIVILTITGIAVLITFAVYNCEGQLSSKEIDTIGYYTKGNCSLINDIPPSIDGTTKKEISKLLSKYKYTKEYQENTFDCSDRSTIVFQLLKAEGFEPWMAYRFSKVGAAHVWVVVFDAWDNGIFVECCYTKNNELGKIVDGNSEKFEYDSAWLMEPSEYETYFKEIEKTSLTMNRNESFEDYIEQIQFFEIISASPAGEAL